MYPKGTTRSRKMASEIARIGIPPRVELAGDARRPLASSPVTWSVDRSLALGNVSCPDTIRRYPKDQPRRVPGYTVEAIYRALRELAVEPPPGTPPDQDALIGVSYLVLDALIGNTDRHHMNWGVL